MNVDSYLASLAVQTTSSETLRAYRHTLTRFEAFLRDKNLRVTQVKRGTVTEFIAYLSEHKGRTVGEALAPATVCRHLAVLSSYYDFLGDNSDGKIKNPVDPVSARRLVTTILGRWMMKPWRRWWMEITDVRDKAMILVYLYSGLRLSELSGLNKDSIVTRSQIPGRHRRVLRLCRSGREGQEAQGRPNRPQGPYCSWRVHQDAPPERSESRAVSFVPQETHQRSSDPARPR